MQDRDDRRRQDWRETRGRGWRGEDDDTQEAHGYPGSEGRTWEPPYDDERTYGRQGQRGGSRLAPRESAGRYPRGGGSYGQGDYSPSAQSSNARDGYRYGSSGKGQTGPGGFPRGGQGGSGNDGDYGQDRFGGGEYLRQSGRGQYRPGEGGYGQGDLSAGRGYEGVYGEGAGRSGRQDRYDETQEAGPGDDYESYAGGGDADDRSGQHRDDFDPDYLEWRRGQLAGYDRDYNHWREAQAQAHDEDYRRWRDERRQKFHEDFHGWRQSRSGPAPGGGSVSAAGTDGSLPPDVDPAIRNMTDGGEGRAEPPKDDEQN